MSNEIVSLEAFRAARRTAHGDRLGAVAPKPFTPVSQQADVALGDAEGQLDFIALALDVEARVEELAGIDVVATDVDQQAGLTLQRQLVARYMAEAESARRFIIERPAAGAAGAAVKLRLALTLADLPADAKRLLRDALAAIAPAKPSASGRDGAA